MLNFRNSDVGYQQQLKEAIDHWGEFLVTADALYINSMFYYFNRMNEVNTKDDDCESHSLHEYAGKYITADICSKCGYIVITSVYGKKASPITSEKDPSNS